MRLIADRTEKKLAGLININMEILSGYKLAAEVIEDKNLKEVFIIYIQKLTEYINELKHVDKDLTGNRNNSYYQEKQLSLFYSDVDETAIFRICENLEEKSIKEYEIVLGDQLPSNIGEILLKQYNGINEFRLHLRSLEEKY